MNFSLLSNVNGVPAGSYTVDKYLVSESYTNVFGSSATILDTWPRFSSTNGLSASNPASGITGFIFSPTITGNQLDVAAYTYAFFVKTNTLGQTINKWVPDDVANLKTAYSVHIMDPNFTGVKEKNEISQFFIYPNPAVDVMKFTYSILESSNISIEIHNITGSHINSIDLGFKGAGSYTSEININKLSSGIYIVQLHAGSLLFQKKLIKIDN